jgi:hypothetical protein
MGANHLPALPTTCEICGGPMTREIVARPHDPGDHALACPGHYERASCRRCDHVVEPETPSDRS